MASIASRSLHHFLFLKSLKCYRVGMNWSLFVFIPVLFRRGTQKPARPGLSIKKPMRRPAEGPWEAGGIQVSYRKHASRQCLLKRSPQCLVPVLFWIPPKHNILWRSCKWQMKTGKSWRPSCGIVIQQGGHWTHQMQTSWWKRARSSHWKPQFGDWKKILRSQRYLAHAASDA
jgi:hypothetical protein